ncbi:MAG: N-acetyltransferase family protein [Acidobacteria bacterium]|nr:N-acetyltransferase family protein [Acidobacteriota bacterium]MCA1611617.1 N-acetyltransferase family protein [Acidobacteriota bacterium]
MSVAIRPVLASDWEAVHEIYVEGIETRQATFETEAPDWKRWDAGHRTDCRLAAHEGDRLLGWAALSPVSSRRVYSGVAEVSVYVAAGARGRGVGEALLRELIRCSEEAGVWTLQASVFPENAPSVRLHFKLGFRQVGVRERIARHHGVWRDTVILERRSLRVGVS